MWVVAASAVPGATVSGFCRDSANTLARGDRPDAMSLQDALVSRRRRAVARVGAAAHSSKNQSAAGSSLIVRVSKGKEKKHTGHLPAM